MEAPFWATLLTVIGLMVAFGRDMSKRFFEAYDEQKSENKTLQDRLDAVEKAADDNAVTIKTLKNDLEDERAATRKERAAKEAAEAVAKATRAENDTLKLEKTQLATHNKAMSDTQADLLKRVTALEDDQKQRDVAHQEELEVERTSRKQVETERDGYKAENVLLREEVTALKQTHSELQRQINTLKDELAETRRQLENVAKRTPTAGLTPLVDNPTEPNKET